MIKEECSEKVRAKVAELKETLTQNGYCLKELRTMDYAVRYDVLFKGNSVGKCIIYFKVTKKTYTFTPQELPNEHVKFLESFFKGIDKKYGANATKAVAKIPTKYKDIKESYDILKKYRNKNFDFYCFANQLLLYITDTKARDDIKANTTDFNLLEQYYNSLIKNDKDSSQF